MSEKILVTYATQGGSTAGVAEAIGKALSAKGNEVIVQPINAVGDITSYKAVVIGSAIHSGKWLPEAREFVERNVKALRRKPTAVFQVCMMLATQNQQYKNYVPEWLVPVRAEIHPLAEGSFAGALWPERYPKLSDKIGLKIFLASIKVKAGDYRNWEAIYTWAESLHLQLAKRLAS